MQTQIDPERSPGVPMVERRRSRGWLLDLYGSAVGKKYVMAATGLLLMGYVLAHLVGMLKLYLGPEQTNHYGEWLRTLAEPLAPRTVTLWIMRMVLLASFVFHIHAAYGLTRINQAARARAGAPGNGKRSGYEQGREYIAANFASRTMRWTGVLVGLFVVFHLMDLTWGNANPEFVRGLAYENTVASFQRVPVAVTYVVANLALGLHLYHGSWSLFQSLGWSHPRFNHLRRWFAVGFALIITLGFVSFPIAVQLGIID